MKIVILSCLLAVVFGQGAFPVPVAILRQEFVPIDDGSFQHAFDAEDGTSVSATGSVGSAGQVNIQGEYTFTLDDGSLAVVRYVANENGYTAESDLLPQVVQKIHPDPPHVAELLRIAEEQRQQGIQFDNQGFRI
ncbi:unnamed protein product [Meganyctiphanes norvegica]|uniref:Uncharacterized protein n=1 Tax=Meganyctiphanes norvegica TaxID=48144 RepID=A0AAV2RZ82_MEGNR